MEQSYATVSSTFAQVLDSVITHHQENRDNAHRQNMVDIDVCTVNHINRIDEQYIVQ